MSQQKDSLISELAERARTSAEEATATWQKLENAGLINKVRVQEYRCRRGCTLGVVIRLRDVVLLRTEAYRLRPRTNEAQSVPAARASRTLDGDHYWPGHVFNVGQLAGQEDAATWGEPTWGETAGIPANCRHAQRILMPADVLGTIRDTIPGKPGKPCLL